MMDAARWERVQQLFHEVADLPEAERRADLEERCGGDAALMGDVLALLEEDAHSQSILDRGLGELADQVLEPSGSALAGDPSFGPYRIKSVLASYARRSRLIARETGGA